MIIRETPTEVTVRVTKVFQELLSDSRIYTQEHDESCRFAIDSLVFFRKDTVIEPFARQYAGAHLCSMGAFSFSNSPLPSAVKIGRYCSVGGAVQTTAGRHPLEALSTSPVFYENRTPSMKKAGEELGFSTRAWRIPNRYKDAPIIGNDVWVGSYVMINAGVSVGDGAVLARAANVVKSVPEYALMGGNPAINFKWRFDPELIERLKAIAWWQYSPADLKNYNVANPEDFARDFENSSLKPQPYAPNPINLWKEVERIY